MKLLPMTQRDIRSEANGLTGALRAFFMIGALVSAPVAGADDWPQWQGPDRNAMCAERGLLQAWTPDGPPLVWKADRGPGGSACVRNLSAIVTV